MCYLLPFYPPNSPKNKNIKKLKKKRLDISPFHKVYQKSIICDIVPEIWHVMHVIFIYHFGLMFCPFTPITQQKIKLSKKWKKDWRYHHLTHVYQKLWLDEVWFTTDPAEIWCMTKRQTDGRMDRKSDIQRWVAHLKKYHRTISLTLFWSLNCWF